MKDAGSDRNRLLTGRQRVAAFGVAQGAPKPAPVSALTDSARASYNDCLQIAQGGPMYAVIRSGGKQYRAVPGETIRVERLPGKVGGKVTFDDVLMVSTEEDKLLAGGQASKAKVTGKIVAHGRGPKLQVMKYKTGGQYKITRGHRQGFTAIEVGDIKLE
jgi:large subunit ribosomal protein L21